MHRPVRMCIICKNRYFQDEMLRLQCKNGKITYYENIGRSFYICNECLNDTKKIIKLLSRRCNKTKQEIKQNLDEIKSKEYA